MLGYTTYDNSAGDNRLSMVYSRASPNQRLVQAFGIDNAFTTTNRPYSKAFKSDVETIIKRVRAAEWDKISEFAKVLVSKAIPKIDEIPSSETIRIRLDLLIQSVTLKVSLYVLYRIDPLELDDRTIEDVATDITELWVMSKNKNQNTHVRKISLKKKIGTLFPDITTDPRDIPLNFILPAYETMWRAVLFGLIEVAFRTSTTPASPENLRNYLSDPTRQSFEQFDKDINTTVSVSHIVNEILRRYPPTKRVYREFHLTKKLEPEVVAGDVEACHLDKTIWGEDALDFCPSRWKNIHPEAKAAFMPFAMKRFWCPARQELAPRMVGLLLASLAMKVSGAEWVLEVQRDGSSDNWDVVAADSKLNASRESRDKLAISRMGTKEA